MGSLGFGYLGGGVWFSREDKPRRREKINIVKGGGITRVL